MLGKLSKKGVIRYVIYVSLLPSTQLVLSYFVLEIKAKFAEVYL